MDNFTCSVCQEIAKNVVESQCCGNLFCEICLKVVINKTNTCPICRQENIQYHASQTIRRMIKDLDVQCQFCKLKLKQGQLDEHELKCEEKTVKCRIDGCRGFNGKQNEVVQHLIQAHQDKLIQLCDPTSEQINPLNTQTKLNQQNRHAKQGTTGKYYCGGQFRGCGCCNGYCGPTNGCNCVGCMKLDLSLRNITQRGYLVNRGGRITKQQADNTFACGTLLYQQKRCGEENEQCDECQRIAVDTYKEMLIDY